LDADHNYVGAAAKTRRQPVGLQDAEEPWTAMHQHPSFLTAADSFRTADPAPPPFTDAYALALGHSGEERSLLPSVKPDNRARGGNAVSRTPPCRRACIVCCRPSS
jgi:hypothetical protein